MAVSHEQDAGRRSAGVPVGCADEAEVVLVSLAHPPDGAVERVDPVTDCDVAPRPPAHDGVNDVLRIPSPRHLPRRARGRGDLHADAGKQDPAREHQTKRRRGGEEKAEDSVTPVHPRPAAPRPLAANPAPDAGVSRSLAATEVAVYHGRARGSGPLVEVRLSFGPSSARIAAAIDCAISL